MALTLRKFLLDLTARLRGPSQIQLRVTTSSLQESEIQRLIKNYNPGMSIPKELVY